MLRAYHIENTCVVLGTFSTIWVYFCLSNSLINKSKAAFLANRNRKNLSIYFISFQ